MNPCSNCKTVTTCLELGCGQKSMPSTATERARAMMAAIGRMAAPVPLAPRETPAGLGEYGGLWSKQHAEMLVTSGGSALIGYLKPNEEVGEVQKAHMRLLGQAREALAAYHAEIKAGGEPTYPEWASDVLLVLA